MPDPLRPASKGDALFPRLSADWFNGVNRAVTAMRGGDVDLAQQQLATASGHSSYITVTVINRSGSDIERPGGVLKLDGLAFTLSDRPKQVFDKPVLKGVTPSDAGDDFVILTKPLKNGKPGTGVKLGLVFCRLNYTDTTGEQSKAAPGTSVSYLVSGSGGVPIFWRELENETGENTIGEQWALVLIGGGLAKAAVAGSFAVASANIDGPEEITWGDVPIAVQDLVDGGEAIGDTETCWTLGEGGGQLYSIVQGLDSEGQPGGSVYVVPVPGSEEVTLYNSAGLVTSGRLLQVKSFTINGREIRVIDVENCST